MEPRERFRPFTHDPATGIRLRAPQLAVVICQIRWPQLTAMEDPLKPKALDLGRSLAAMFPLYAETQEVSFTITPDGVTQSQGDTVYQWSSADSVWQASLTKRSIALSCVDYQGYDSFAERLLVVVEAAHGRFDVPLTERVGLRYVNRFDDPRVVDDPGRFVDRGVLGFAAVPLRDGQVELTASVNQAVYSVYDVNLQTRSGLVPAGQALDPSVAILDKPSWVVDLDAYVERRRSSTIEADMSTVSRLADVAYDFFKLIAKDELVRLFGDDPT